MKILYNHKILIYYKKLFTQKSHKLSEYLDDFRNTLYTSWMHLLLPNTIVPNEMVEYG